MNKNKTAGSIMKGIAMRNGFGKNKEISEKIGISYEIVNRSLREDKKIGDKMLKNFFEAFPDITFEEKKEIQLLIDLSKSTDLVRDEFERMASLVVELKEHKEGSEAQKIFGDALEFALQRGLLKYLMDKNK